MTAPAPALLEMLQQLIASPSISCVSPEWDQSNAAVIQQLAEWLSALGFRCDILPVEEAPGKFNLIATLGSGAGGLVLAGHTDTVPCNPERWRSDPFQLTERDGRLHGLGIADMKGFFPLIITAVQQLGEGLAGRLREPLIVLATADEESSMAGARALLRISQPHGRYAVIGEPTGLRPVRAHKGVMMEAVRLIGHAGHSSNPALGHNALDAMHDVMTELKTYRSELAQRYRNPMFTVPVPTLNLGCLHGGDNPNRICAACELQFDLRPLPGMDMDELREQLRQRLQPVARAHQVTLELVSLSPGTQAFELPADSALVQSAERLTGHAAIAVAFGTEAPYLSELGMQTLVLGPGDIDCAHQPDEYLQLDRLQPTITLLQALIREHCC